ncbi:hypothetical protein LQW54_001894 [Pestalotiopsis sp. IQ-011]
MSPFTEPLWVTRGASPYYQASHHRLQAEVERYVREYISPFCHEWEANGRIPDDVMVRHARLGYTAASIYPLATDYLGDQKLPAGISPQEWDGFHDLILIDGIARCGYLGVIWGLSCGNSIGAPPLVNFGNAAQKRKFLPGILDGTTRFCLGVTEPEAGSDVAGIATTAERRGNHYVVNGFKKWITNGIFADYCTAAVRTGGPGSKGVSALIIPLGTKGVNLRKLDNSGVNASGSTFIEFDDVEVPVENLLGRESEGFKIIMSNFNHERLWLACTSLRMARVCADDAWTHAMLRETFGKKLIENQAIRSKIALFGRSINSAHAWMEQIVYLIEQGKTSGKDPLIAGPIAGLKVLAAQVLEKVNREAQQVLGGLGYSKEGRGARIEQISRDVRVMAVGGGSEEILVDLAVSQDLKTVQQLEPRSRL